MNYAEDVPLEPSRELQRLTVHLIILIQSTQFKRHQRSPVLQDSGKQFFGVNHKKKNIEHTW